MKEEVLRMIQSIQSDKVDQNRVPNYAVRYELMALMMKNFNQSLVELEQEGRIKIGNTLNDTYYQTN